MRKLSRGQKSWVTKQSKTFSEVIKKPSEFSTISAKTKTHKSQAQAAGLPVTNGKAVVKVGKGGHVRRRGDKIVIKNDERKVEAWFANSATFKKELDRARKRKLEPNQVWAFKIGDNVNNVNFRDLNQLLHYLGDKDDWHTEDGSAPDHVSLVLITVNRSHIIASLAT